MIINQMDAQFQYKGVTYTIGGKVRANDASDYAGLYGTITEIRDGGAPQRRELEGHAQCVRAGAERRRGLGQEFRSD